MIKKKMKTYNKLNSFKFRRQKGGEDMKMMEKSDKPLEEQEHIWVTVDVKEMPSIILVSLASYIKDEEALDVLADSSNISVKLHVAENPFTSGKTLQKLSKESGIPFLKESIAAHVNAFKETLEELSKDEDEKVRRMAASNPKTPRSALILRLFDSSLDVVIAAIRNPATPKENIEMLKEGSNPIITYEVQRRLQKETILSPD